MHSPAYDELVFQRLQLQIKKEIKQEYILPLRESVIMLNRLIPDCDLTLDAEPENNIETIDLTDEMEQATASAAAVETMEVEQHPPDMKTVEPSIQTKAMHKNVVNVKKASKEQPFDDFSGDLLFESIQVIYLFNLCPNSVPSFGYKSPHF